MVNPGGGEPIGVSAVQFGILTTIEMVTAMLCYIPVAYFADKSSKKPFVVTTFISLHQDAATGLMITLLAE